DHVRRDAGERPVLRLEVAEHPVAEDAVAVPGEPALMRPRAHGVAAEVHELLRPRHRERREEHLVEERKDRRIGADAERERQYGNDRDERRLEERPESQLEIPHGLLDNLWTRKVQLWTTWRTSSPSGKISSTIPSGHAWRARSSPSARLPQCSTLAVAAVMS